MKNKMTLKDTLLSTLENGKNILEDISVTRRNGKDFTANKDVVENKIASLHPNKLELQVSEIYEVTKESKVFRFVSKNGYLPPFQAGQYINIFVEIDGIRTSRPYSISSSPRQRGYYEITVAKIAKGFISDYFLNNVKVGLEVEANGPCGVFCYNPVFHSKKSVFLAGGSGITPFMSMIREIVESGIDREIHLIYGSKNENLAMYNLELIETAKKYKNFKYTLVISDDSSFSGHKGFIDAKCISEVIKNIDECTFYLCGPQVMTDFCDIALKGLNVKGKNIRREMFGSRQDIQNELGWPAELNGTEIFKIQVDGKTIEAKSNESVLCALERAKIRVNVCCRSGECSLCRVRLVEGKVFMPRGVLLRLADEKFGYIHSCKAFPISDLKIKF